MLSRISRRPPRCRPRRLPGCRRWKSASLAPPRLIPPAASISSTGEASTPSTTSPSSNVSGPDSELDVTDLDLTGLGAQGRAGKPERRAAARPSAPDEAAAGDVGGSDSMTASPPFLEAFSTACETTSPRGCRPIGYLKGASARRCGEAGSFAGRRPDVTRPLPRRSAMMRSGRARRRSRCRPRGSAGDHHVGRRSRALRGPASIDTPRGDGRCDSIMSRPPGSRKPASCPKRSSWPRRRSTTRPAGPPGRVGCGRIQGADEDRLTRTVTTIPSPRRGSPGR